MSETVQTQQPAAYQYQYQPASVSRGSGSGTLYDVLELILDRGLVIDAFIRVSLLGIELLTIDVRVVVASVDTYLRFAEVCNRLDLTRSTRSASLPDLTSRLMEGGARGRSRGAVGGIAEGITDAFREDARGRDHDHDQDQAEPRSGRPTRGRSSQRSPAE